MSRNTLFHNDTPNDSAAEIKSRLELWYKQYRRYRSFPNSDLQQLITKDKIPADLLISACTSSKILLPAINEICKSNLSDPYWDDVHNKLQSNEEKERFATALQA